MQQQVNHAKQRVDKRKGQDNKIEDDDDDDEQPKKKSRGSLQRERKRKQRESGEDPNEAEQIKVAIAQAKKVRREARIAAEKEKKAIERKGVKPPKKKKQSDKEEESFDNMVDSYRSTIGDLGDAKASKGVTNPREAVKEKRWFE